MAGFQIYPTPRSIYGIGGNLYAYNKRKPGLNTLSILGVSIVGSLILTRYIIARIVS
jgi:hypothetical protein